MATRLRKMNLHEISLVDRGASKGAHVILTKRDVTGETRDGAGKWAAGGAAAALGAVGVKFGRTVNPKRAKVSALATGGSTEGERSAARAALGRLPADHGFELSLNPGKMLVGAAVGAGLGLGARYGYRMLTKRDVSDEARDALGRWTTSAAGAAGAGAKVMVNLAHSLAVESAKNAGHVVSNTKLMGMQPVANGGLQFHMRSATRSGASIHTFVQVRPEHVKGSGVLSELLNRTHTVLSAYGRALVPPINGLFRGAYIPPNGAYDAGAARGNIVAAAQAAVRPAATPAQAAVTISADDMKRSQGVPSPDNGIPMNVARMVKVPGTNSFIPLNHPTFDSTNAGSHPYLNEDGDFIPAGSADKQAFIDKNNSAEAFSKLPTFSGPGKSNGAAYINNNGHVIPPGNIDQQSKYEDRYAQWDKDSDAVMAAMSTMPTAREVPASSGLSKDIPITRVPAGPKPDDSLHWSEADKKPNNPYAFGKRRAPSLFSECGNIYLFKRDETPKLFNSPSVHPELFRKSTA